MPHTMSQTQAAYRRAVAAAAAEIAALPGYDPETVEHATRAIEDGTLRGVMTVAKMLNATCHTYAGYDRDTLIVFAVALRDNLLHAGGYAGGKFHDFVNRACRGAKTMTTRPDRPAEITQADIDAARTRLSSPLFD